MSMRILAAAGLAAALIATAGQGAGAHPAANVAPGTYPATVQVVQHPVTASGHANRGYQVKRGQGKITCSPANPSPGARTKNIEFCSPSYEAAVACWESATPHHALCLRDPQTKVLAKLRLTGGFAPTKRAPKKQRAPLSLVLTDGTVCSIRDGGAWGTLQSHPKWYGTYSCSHHGVVWSPPNADHSGIDESQASWRVRTAPASGKGKKIVTRHVKRAYFVATLPRGAHS
jgi:hypothetical protein